MQTYDLIVLGAGAMGSAAAYYAARRGQRVLLLEQFEIDHRYGSSWGYTRIIRYSYDDPEYVQLARETYPLWRELEAEAEETFWVVTGGIDFGSPQDARLQATIKTVRDAGLEHEILSASDANRRFPQFNFNDDMIVLYQPDSGLITPSRCVQAHVRLAQKRGATVLDHTPVTGLEIHEGGEGVTVRTESDTFTAARLILTGGAWGRKLLADQTQLDLPLQPLRCQEAQFSTDDPQYHSPNMPVFIYHRAVGDFAARDPYAAATSMYGLPNHDGSGVKAAFHAGTPFDHPSEISYTPDMAVVDKIRAEIGETLPLVRHAPLSLTRICLYTMTPDEHFIIDRHPTYPQVTIGAGFSGHGFKFSTGIGKILTDLALDGTTPHDISLFRVGRFN